ncbi:MAG: hypothetical protein JWP01_156 [Myxococcales bacterium]|nr:hypothetical protein [Myxococcales bacterium]
MSTQPKTPIPTTESTDTLESIRPEQLECVAGGASRVSGKGGDSEVTAMLTQIGNSIKDLAASKNTSGGGDTMQLMMMMLMMGGGGGGGGVAPAGAPPVINLDTSVAGGGCFRRKGKKGW